jgi:hypothetical protein
MNANAWYRRGAALLLGAAAFVTGCTDGAPLAPTDGNADAREIAVSGMAASVAPDLGVCGNLQVPAGSRLVFRTYASGVQIYHWDGTSWVFDAPLAVLSADAGGRSTVGTHYAGPTWESNSGSKVVGAVLQRCTPDPAAIPWLLLGAVSSSGPGIFQRVTYIQRVNTVGGNAPSAPGSVVGEEARIPYTTEYFFYRTK